VSSDQRGPSLHQYHIQISIMGTKNLAIYKSMCTCVNTLDEHVENYGYKWNKGCGMASITDYFLWPPLIIIVIVIVIPVVFLYFQKNLIKYHQIILD